MKYYFIIFFIFIVDNLPAADRFDREETPSRRASEPRVILTDHADKFDREKTPLRRASDPLVLLSDYSDSARNKTPSRRRHSDEEEVRASDNPSSCCARNRSVKTLPLKQTKSSSCSTSPRQKAEFSKIAPRIIYYKLWPLNCKIMPNPPIVICPEDQVQSEEVFEVVMENSVDIILYNDIDSMEKLNLACEENLDTELKIRGVKIVHVTGIEQCEKEIAEINPNKNRKQVCVFGLSKSKANYELLTQLTIAGYIRDAQKRNENFKIGDSTFSFKQILKDEGQVVRMAAILTKRALKKIMEHKSSLFLTQEEGELQKFCLKRLIPLMPEQSRNMLLQRF